MDDFLIKHGYLFGRGVFDIAVQGGRIRAIGPHLADPAREVIDACNKTIFPAFIDLHTHTDKAFTKEKVPNPSGTLMEAVDNMGTYFQSASEQDILERSIRMVELEIGQGVGTLRSHISIDPVIGRKTWRVARELKARFQNLVTIQLVAFCGVVDYLAKGDPYYQHLEVALADGADLLGGCPEHSKDHRAFTDAMFALAREFDVPLDLHVDERDEPDASALAYVAEKTMAEGMEGRVAASHCTSLSAVPPPQAAQIIKKVKDAGIHIVTLPSCNLHLMGRHDTVAPRRGTTRIKEFLEAGVNISLASDNIRDPFRPYGNGDMLEEANLTAQVMQAGTDREFRQVLSMVTENPARAAGIADYGLREGAFADLVVVDAPDPVDALLGKSLKSLVMLKGKAVVRRQLDETILIEN